MNKVLGDSDLTHVDEHGRATMVDVSNKPATLRHASAHALLKTTPDVAQKIGDGSLPKGDVIAVCRIAGIMAAKRTAELIPLAHQVPLSKVDIEIEVNDVVGEVNFLATARTVSGTGVEIEAMVAASVAAITCYDMIKAVDRTATISTVQVVEKYGGRSGHLKLNQ